LVNNFGSIIIVLKGAGFNFYFILFYFILFCVTQSLELWDIRDKNTMTFNAHDGLVAALAASSATGKVASVSHDRTLKLWK